MHSDKSITDVWQQLRKALKHMLNVKHIDSHASPQESAFGRALPGLGLRGPSDSGSPRQDHQKIL